MENNAAIDISIVIPTKNERDYIGPTIEQFRDCLEKFNLEIIVSDAYSTDGTAEVVQAYHREFGDRVRLVQITEIERIVCETFGLDRRALQSASRSQQLAQPRMLAMWLARRHTPAGLHEISKHFGRRSHTTVLSAEKRVENWLTQGTHMRLGTESQRISDIVRKIERHLRAG